MPPVRSTPLDLKTATAEYLIDILAPVHDYVCNR